MIWNSLFISSFQYLVAKQWFQNNNSELHSDSKLCAWLGLAALGYVLTLFSVSMHAQRTSSLDRFHPMCSILDLWISLRSFSPTPQNWSQVLNSKEVLAYNLRVAMTPRNVLDRSSTSSFIDDYRWTKPLNELKPVTKEVKIQWAMLGNGQSSFILPRF